MRSFWSGLIATAIFLAPGPAAAETGKVLCCGAKLALTFGDAGLEVKLLTLILWLAGVAAVVVWVRALRRLRVAPSDTSVRALAVLAGWRIAAPLLAVAGVSYQLMNSFVAIYAYPPAPSWRVYAPGLAEMSMVLWAGFLTGGIAALTHAHLKSRV